MCKNISLLSSIYEKICITKQIFGFLTSNILSFFGQLIGAFIEVLGGSLTYSKLTTLKIQTFTFDNYCILLCLYELHLIRPFYKVEVYLRWSGFSQFWVLNLKTLILIDKLPTNYKYVSHNRRQV